MIQQRNNFWWFKLNGLLRYLMVHCTSNILPLYIVNEFPKSGGSWVSQMLAEYLGVPFPRNAFPELRSSIIHGHYLYFPTMRNVFVVMRDGRDVMVSYYYHSFFLMESQLNQKIVEETRKGLPFTDYNDIYANLPRFIEYQFTHRSHPKFTWCEFVNSWIKKKNIPIIYYERLLEDTVKELGEAVYSVTQIRPDEERLRPIVEKYSFKNQAGRNPGEENKHSFLRKGLAGDWKNHFSPEARRVFHKFAGQELITLGYENDDSWKEL